METKEYHSMDKSGWKPGPWMNEPDKIQFVDDATGLPCLIVRAHSGALCGYVGVPEGHPVFEKDYNEVRRIDAAGDDDYIDVHGGLTFADHCRASDDESHGICHLPAEGEPDNVWWLGFDCAHAWDYTPSYSSRPEACFQQGMDEVYRDVNYVKSEIRKLAKQLIAIT